MVALYRTVIIEDDAVITQLNKRYVEKEQALCREGLPLSGSPHLFRCTPGPFLAAK